MEKVKIAAEEIKEQLGKAIEQQAKALVPRARSCMLKTKNGQSKELKFWIHTNEFFQYYEKGFEVEDIGGGQYMIKGDAVVVPNHEIRYIIIRDTQNLIPEDIFLSLGGVKKMIQVVSE
ncbi:hypothetical protein KAU34_02470 [candidate division WOR-3 bacterium]|nr:hypothetical protein [candidate division WOR-3 bacterium]